MNPNIAIIGAGPAGLILAVSLARRGIPSVIFEAMDDPSKLEKFNPSRSYAIDITGHGLKALRHIYAVEDFDRKLIPFNGLKVNGKVVDRWDEPGWIASRGDIVTTLTEIATGRYSDYIDIRFNQRLKGVDVHAGSLELEDTNSGETKPAGPYSLVVAADGGGSVAREQAEAQDKDYVLTREDTGYFFKMLAMDQNTEQLDKNYLEILSKKTMMAAGAINGPGGQDDPLWFSAVAYREDKRYANAAAVKADMSKRCPGVLPFCSDEALEAFAQLPAQNIGRITSASQLYAGRVVFLGDAAISYPPIGQGINGAMESAMVLDQALQRHAEDLDSTAAVKAALQSYSEAWLPETRAVSWFGRKINQANPWHVFRALLLEVLRVGVLHNTKSSKMPYSEAQRKAKWLGPLWIG